MRVVGTGTPPGPGGGVPRPVVAGGGVRPHPGGTVGRASYGPCCPSASGGTRHRTTPYAPPSAPPLHRASHAAVPDFVCPGAVRGRAAAGRESAGSRPGPGRAGAGRPWSPCPRGRAPRAGEGRGGCPEPSPGPGGGSGSPGRVAWGVPPDGGAGRAPRARGGTGTGERRARGVREGERSGAPPKTGRPDGVGRSGRPGAAGDGRGRSRKARERAGKARGREGRQRAEGAGNAAGRRTRTKARSRRRPGTGGRCLEWAEKVRNRRKAPHRRSPHGPTKRDALLCPGADSPHGIRPGAQWAAPAAGGCTAAICRDPYAREGRSKLPGERAPATHFRRCPPRHLRCQTTPPKTFSDIAFLDSPASTMVTSGTL